MSLIKVRRVNNVVVEPVPLEKQTKKDLKPVRGAEMLPEIYIVLQDGQGM
jgi:hypothetical protein